MAEWTEIADGVLHARYQPIDVSIVAVVGEAGVLLVDSRCNPREGAELAADVDALGLGPTRWLVNTHAHYDHAFGNQAFPGALVFGHARIPAHFAEFEEPRLAAWRSAPEAQPQYDWADVVPTPPDRLLTEETEVDLGGRLVRLLPLRPGHTDTDLVVHVPDVGVWIVGDVVEESGPPMYGSGSFPLEWPGVVERLSEGIGMQEVVIPGHGKPVDRAFLVQQAGMLDAVAAAIRTGHAAGATPERIAAAASEATGWTPDWVEPAVRRGLASLGGRPRSPRPLPSAP
ncbi:MBL fold metallo-hydrolase [Agromyces seonyuensis]|uniref:MBL fold metallo-hydrolase n=1 Tax=Agromyces seonyuensis TaxID=2662446 RepID=A0A6I4P4M8_9MICO|nr:MBL fold metallo-hydrolase [Agromyces seonyuensis]MWB99279.1 MBL fold metallo-hydrolase [Agromyces seonyuensis]